MQEENFGRGGRCSPWSGGGPPGGGRGDGQAEATCARDVAGHRPRRRRGPHTASAAVPTRAAARSRRADGEDEPATNPEELIGAGTRVLHDVARRPARESDGHPAARLRTKATVHPRARECGGGSRSRRIELETVGDVAGLDEEAFAELAERAKATCPVSRALRGTEIGLSASLGVTEARARRRGRRAREPGARRATPSQCATVGPDRAAGARSSASLASRAGRSASARRARRRRCCSCSAGRGPRRRRAPPSARSTVVFVRRARATGGATRVRRALALVSVAAPGRSGARGAAARRPRPRRARRPTRRPPTGPSASSPIPRRGVQRDASSSATSRPGAAPDHYHHYDEVIYLHRTARGSCHLPYGRHPCRWARASTCRPALASTAWRTRARPDAGRSASSAGREPVGGLLPGRAAGHDRPGKEPPMTRHAVLCVARRR